MVSTEETDFCDDCSYVDLYAVIEGRVLPKPSRSFQQDGDEEGDRESWRIQRAVRHADRRREQILKNGSRSVQSVQLPLAEKNDQKTTDQPGQLPTVTRIVVLAQEDTSARGKQPERSKAANHSDRARRVSSMHVRSTSQPGEMGGEMGLSSSMHASRSTHPPNHKKISSMHARRSSLPNGSSVRDGGYATGYEHLGHRRKYLLSKTHHSKLHAGQREEGSCQSRRYHSSETHCKVRDTHLQRSIEGGSLRSGRRLHLGSQSPPSAESSGSSDKLRRDRSQSPSAHDVSDNSHRSHRSDTISRARVVADQSPTKDDESHSQSGGTKQCRSTPMGHLSRAHSSHSQSGGTKQCRSTPMGRLSRAHSSHSQSDGTKQCRSTPMGHLSRAHSSTGHLSRAHSSRSMNERSTPLSVHQSSKSSDAVEDIRKPKPGYDRINKQHPRFPLPHLAY